MALISDQMAILILAIDSIINYMEKENLFEEMAVIMKENII